MELTVEQQFKIRQLSDLLNKDTAQKEDIITIFLALQRQNFCLTNTIRNLLDKWPKHLPTTPEGRSKFGISSETSS